MKRLVLISILFAAACGMRGAGEPGANVVALIDGQPVLRTELELYFRVNLLDPPEPAIARAKPGGAEMDRVKSRLFDEFMEEQTLLAEARRRAIRVSEQEIEAYLDLARIEGYGVTDLALDSRRLLARTRLLIQKLQEKITAEIPSPTETEVYRYAAQAEGLPAADKRLLARVLPVDSMETAEAIYSDIRRNRTTFAEAAQAHETQPGQASPQTLDWSHLPQSVRQALENLNPGQVSAPLDHNGLIYLFQVQAWLEDEGWSERERLRAAREELVRLKGFEANYALMQRLKKNSVIQLQTESLQFRYIPDAER